MGTVVLTEENFQRLVDAPGTLVIDWWAPWCGPCRAFAPIYESAAEQHTDVVFGKINTEEEPELAGAFGIQSIPTLMVFRDQILLFARPGMMPPAQLDDLVSKVKALDMDDVRKQVSAREAAEAAETGSPAPEAAASGGEESSPDGDARGDHKGS